MRAGVAEPEAEVVREGPLEPGLEHARPRPPVRALAREDDERRRRVVPVEEPDLDRDGHGKARGEVIERLEGRLAEREGDENKVSNE